MRSAPAYPKQSLLSALGFEKGDWHTRPPAGLLTLRVSVLPPQTCLRFVGGEDVFTSIAVVAVLPLAVEALPAGRFLMRSALENRSNRIKVRPGFSAKFKEAGQA
jgi:hypothetical protein